MLAAFLNLTSGLLAVSQEKKEEPEKPRLSREDGQILKDRLQLSDAEQAKVVALLEQNLADRQRIREKYEKEGTDSSGMRGELQEARKQLFTKLGEVLSTEQMAEYRKLLDERRTERRKNRPDSPG
jgi:Spy/CpxP family protein refolding chaperone